jgi:NADH dehydrogenase
MAGQIAELARKTLRSNFRRIDPSSARILLIDALPTILAQFDMRLSTRAADKLQRIGVEIRLGVRVTSVDRHGIDVSGPDPSLTRIGARTKIWAAGVHASPLGAMLATAAAVQFDRGGRVPVLPNCSLPGRPEVFVVGDMMALDDLPGVAEVAIQSGRHAAAEIERRRRSDATPHPFRYCDLGTLASISRSFAVAQIGPIRIAGLAGWLLWLFVHLSFLTGFKTRVSALWIISFVGRGRAERTITIQQVFARAALESAQPDDGMRAT